VKPPCGFAYFYQKRARTPCGFIHFQQNQVRTPCGFGCFLPTGTGCLPWFRDQKEAHPRAASCAIGTKKGLSTLPMDRPFEVLLLEV